MKNQTGNLFVARTWVAGVTLAALAALFAGAAAAPSAVAAEVPGAGATGTIAGRILNSGTGEYLENARVTVEGAGLEALTNVSASICSPGSRRVKSG
jgi:hypothetical protein